MFESYSMTQSGGWIVLVCNFLGLLGTTIAPADLITTITTLQTIGNFIGGVVVLIGRWRKGDINIFGRRHCGR